MIICSNFRPQWQVSNKVTFPREPKVSSACKALITKILAPLKTRVRISGIRADPWFNYTGEKPGSSKEQSADSEQSQSRLTEPSREAIGTLVTKKQLREEARKRDKPHYSTDEETPIASQMPESPRRSDEIKREKK